MKTFRVLVALVGVAACTDVPYAPTSPSRPSLVPTVARSSGNKPINGQYIVRFRDNEPDADGRAHSIERSHGAKVERVYTTAIKGAAMAMADDAAAALRADPNVLSVEQDQEVHLTTTQANPAWGLDRIDQRNRPYSGSYTYAVTGAGVTVYIIDTGINFTHQEYSGRASKGIDEVTIGGTAADCNGHGSHVSGTVGGTTYGVAKGVSLVAVRVLDCSGSGTVSGVVAGIDWVTAHAVRPAVANMSLGGGFSATLNSAVQNSIAAGVTYGIAAGNSGGSACLESPSSAPNAITVAASDSLDSFASFSNFGTCVDIIAPGVNVKSAWIGSNTATNIISGTSMATPHVVGAAALYLQANPTATPAQVAAALTTNATPSVITGIPAPQNPLNPTPNLLLYTGFITGGGGTNQPPVARFTWTCVGQSVPNQCALDGSTSTDDVGILTWNWNWGNGRPAETKTVSTVKNTWLAPGVYTVTLTVTDGGGLTNSTSQPVTVGSPPPNQPPTASITSPANNTTFTQGASVSFTGSGSDPEDGALTGASLVWTSSIDGAIGSGTSFSKTNLSLGTHTITLTATDSKGATGTATCTITVAPPNQPPTASITSPANNTTVTQGASVSFTGSGSDPEDGALTGASLVWTSSIDGAIGSGTSFSKTNLSLGTHTITLTATDSKGATGTATRTITVAPPNQPPTASITSPANNTTVTQGASVSFTGSGSDPEDGALTGASLVWTSSIDGAIGSGTSFSKTNLSLGTHTITLTATDSKGATGTATRTIAVAPPNQPPTSSITSPANNTTVTQGASVSFTGSGSDPEDGALTGASLVWTSSIDGAIGSGTSFSKTNLSLGTHTITLTATDSKGATGTATRTITVASSNQPPVANFTTNCVGQTNPHQCTFDGSSSTDDHGIVTWVWNWGNGRPIETKTAPIARNTFLVAGTYQVTLTVTDGSGVTNSITKSVVVP